MANFHHAVVLNEGGYLFSCGSNEAGQLGTSDNLDRTEFVLISCPVKFTSVSCGHDNFTVAVAEDGTLWAWGSNAHGQTGLPTSVNQPTQIPNTQNFIDVSCANFHSIALDSSGFAWGFGDNSFGQLGTSPDQTSNVSIPTVIPSINDIQMISCTSSFNLFLNRSNQVWGCGDNQNGQLGLGHTTNRHVPTLIPGLKDIQLISTGHEHSLALDSQGQVFGFGSNGWMQLGLDDCSETTSPRAIPGLKNCIYIMCGGTFSVVHVSNGRVMVFGDHTHQQLGLPEEASGYTGCIGVPTENPDLEDKIIIPGAYHMLVGHPNGDLSCYGAFESKMTSTPKITLSKPVYLRKKFGKKPKSQRI